MTKWRLIATMLVALGPGITWAEDRLVRLFAAPELVETGLIRHIVPRFSLKTQVRVDLVESQESADLVLGRQGRALFEGEGGVWHLDVRSQTDPDAQKFADWLASDVGRRTVLSFAPDGAALFQPPPARETTVVAVAPDGDVTLGKTVSRRQCARCHAVDDATRMSGIGSTPSFFVLRALGDWQERFSAFYALNPHPSFTFVDGVTPAFAADRPPPIHPIVMTLPELEAVMAYVAGLTPADLGAPLQSSDF
ncbi:MAG: hypothetical protein ACWA5A_01150 [Marinibacterium sp.]